LVLFFGDRERRDGERKRAACGVLVFFTVPGGRPLFGDRPRCTDCDAPILFRKKNNYSNIIINQICSERSCVPWHYAYA
jgi:hypothetical protein